MVCWLIKVSYPWPRAQPVRTIYPASTALRDPALRAFLPSKEAPFLRRTRSFSHHAVPLSRNFCGRFAAKEFCVRQALSALVLFCRLSSSISRLSHPEIPLQANLSFDRSARIRPCTCSLERHGVTPRRVLFIVSRRTLGPSAREFFWLDPDCKRTKRAMRPAASSQHYNTPSPSPSCGKK